MFEVNPDITTTVASIVGGAGAIIFGLSKAIKVWSSDRGEIQKFSSESDLFQRMSSELKRLGETNKAQEEEIAELRAKISVLLDDFNNFKIASARRDAELAALRVRLISTNTDFDPLH